MYGACSVLTRRFTAMCPDRSLYELYHPTEPAWLGWVRCADLEVRAPKLPVASSSFRHTWHLAPSLMPVHQAHVQPLSDVKNFERDLRRAWHVADPMVRGVLPLFSEDSFELQRQVFLGAEAG